MQTSDLAAAHDVSRGATSPPEQLPSVGDEQQRRPIYLQYWAAAKRWAWVMAGIVAVCLAIGLLATLLTQPLYTAGSRIEISREQKNITNVPGLDQNVAAYDNEFYDTQYALLRSDSLAMRVAHNLGLATDPAFFAAHGVNLSGSGAGKPPVDVRQRESLAAALLLQNVQINPIRNSSLVTILYTSRSPTESAKIANSWPREFIGSSIDRQFATTADARRYLEDRLNALRVKLAQSENELISFTNANDLTKIGAVRDASGKTEEPRTLVASNLEALNTALVAARTDRIAAESKARTNGRSSADVLQNGTIGSLRSKRAEVAADYAKILVQFEPRYPGAMALKSQLDALDAAIARETSQVSGLGQAAYREAVSREQQLAAQVAAEKAIFDRQQRATIQYNVLQREVDTNRQLYDALLQRYKEIGVAGNVGATNIVIVDTAKVPGGPSSPNLTHNLFVALLIGLMLAAVAVFALEQIDEGIRDPRDVERVLRLPLIGTVPITTGSAADEVADPKSAIAEAYFSARTALALTTSHGFPKSVMVTSAQPREGKSVTALALAAAMGRAGKSVLLIDGDLRSPALHSLLGERNGAGFSNLLSGSEVSAGMLRPTSLKGVAALFSGPLPPSAPDLLSSERLAAVLDQLGGRYDHIIIDGPPVIGLADAPLLGGAVEGSVLVIDASSTAMRSAGNAIRRLKIGHNRLFGAILTKVPHGQMPYGYGYGQGYGYGRDAEQSEAALAD